MPDRGFLVMDNAYEVYEKIAEDLNKRCILEHTRNLKSIIKKNIDLHPESKLGNPQDIFAKATDSLSKIADISIPAAVSFAMHFYPLCALKALPLSKLSKEAMVRTSILKKVKKEVAIISNSGGGKDANSIKVIADIKQNGHVILNGSLGYMSLAGVSDYALVRAFSNTHGSIMCLIPASSPGFHIGTYLFNDSMKSTLTAKVDFHDCEIDKGHYLTSPSDTQSKYLFTYQRIWFHLIISHVYSKGIKLIVKRICEQNNGQPPKNVSPVLLKLALVELSIEGILSKMQNISDISALDDDFLLKSSSPKYLVSEAYDLLNSLVYDHIGAEAFLDSDINNMLSELRYIKIQPTSNRDIMSAYSGAAFNFYC